MALSDRPSVTLPGGDRTGGARALVGTVATIGGGQLGAQLLTAVLLLVLTRDDATQLGLTATYYGIAMSTTQLADGGVATRVLRDGGRGPVDPTALRSVCCLKPLLLLVLALCVGLATGSLALGLALGYAAPRLVGLVAQARWQVDGRPARAAGTVLLERAIASAVAVPARQLGVTAPIALGLGLVVGSVAVAALAWPGLTRSWQGGRAAPRAALTYGLRFVGGNIAGNLVLLDSAVVTVVAGARAAGLYSVGARLLGPFVLLISAGSTALLPALTRGERGAVRALRWLGVLTVAGLALVGWAARPLVLALAGGRFAAAVPAVRWYLLTAALVVLAQFMVVLLQARGEETAVSVLLPVGVLAGLGGVAVGAAVVRVDPAAGAAAGYAVCAAVVTAVLVVRVRRGGRHSGQRQRDGDGDVAPGDVAQW